MRNAAFCLLTEAEKNSKFRAILNDKTERTLTAEEMGSILLCVSPHKQCSIVVHNDADNDNTRGELYCPTLPAAILLKNQADESSAHQLHIYIPPSRLRKGNQKV